MLPDKEIITKEIYIGNIDNSVTEEEVRELFGLNSTKYLRVSLSEITKDFEENGRFAGCFLLMIPQYFVESILEANGSKFRNRYLVVQPYTDMLRYNLKN